MYLSRYLSISLPVHRAILPTSIQRNELRMDNILLYHHLLSMRVQKTRYTTLHCTHTHTHTYISYRTQQQSQRWQHSHRAFALFFDMVDNSHIRISSPRYLSHDISQYMQHNTYPTTSTVSSRMWINRCTKYEGIRSDEKNVAVKQKHVRRITHVVGGFDRWMF